MNADELDPLEEEFTSRLAACDEALVQGAGAAAARVDGTPPELRERLERGVACLRMLGQMWPEPSRADTEQTLLQGSVPPAPLASLGRFQIRRELGRGGFGVVFLAYDALLGREVALKIPRADALVDPALRRRFQHEAQAAARLDHPSIVPVHDAGEVGPLCFIASAFCPGVTLAAWLEERAEPVPWRLAATLVANLADGIQHAHSRGVLHRDLKPSNVILQTKPTTDHTDNTDKVKKNAGSSVPSVSSVVDYLPRITDFGLAKLLTENGLGVSAGQTRSGAIIGTAGYMAPEQAEGKINEIGTAADVYALGAILYELLTGRPVFEAPSELALLDQVRGREPISPERLRANLPRDLATICLKCLQKQPAQRYGSAGELAEDLRRCLAGEPVRARPVGAWERGWRWVRRRPAIAALIAVSVLAVLAMVGVAVGLWFNGQLQTALAEAKDQRLEADNQRREAQQQRARAEQLELRQRYIRDVNLAHKAWQDAHIGRALELLAAWQPAQSAQPDLRGWEWHYLRGLCRQELGTLKGTGEPILALAFSPDGKRLATGGGGNSLSLWEWPGGREIVTLSHSLANSSVTPKTIRFSVVAVSFSLDGRWLASASNDGTVKVWDTATWKESARFQPRQGPVRWLAFSRDGQRLASGGGDTVTVWQRTGGGGELELRGHKGNVNSVTFNEAGQELVSAGSDGTLRLWDANSGEEKAVLSARAGAVNCVVYIPGTTWAAAACQDASIRIWDTADERQVRRLGPHGNGFGRLAVSPDGGYLASTGSDGTVKVWSLAAGLASRTLRGHSGRISALTFTPDGTRLVSAGADTVIRIWDPLGDHGMRTLRGHAHHVSWVAFSPDGRSLASASWDRSIKLWDGKQMEERYSLGGHTATVGCVAFSPKGDLLATSSSDKTVRLWDPASGKELRTLTGPAASVRLVAFTPDGRHLVSGDGKGMITVWEPGTGRETHRFKCHDGAITDLVFSPDGQRLASCSPRDGAKIWDVATKKLHMQVGSKERILCIAFSPDGQSLAAGSGAGEITLWDTATGAAKATLKGHSLAVYGLAFGPDGRRLASAGADKTVRLWDPASGLETFTLTGHQVRVVRVAFSPDGRRLASASGERGIGELKIWEIADAADHP